MNWNNEKSIGLTKFFIILFAAAYVLVVAFCPVMTREFVRHSFSARGKDALLFTATIYASAVPLGIILWNLYRMIGRIGEEQIFSEENVRCLRLISWMCFAVAAVCLVSTAYYVFFLIIAACAAFMGLLIRVIKNVFERAREIKEENDYTV
ncbi:DUF2975 domain-containing protein [[Clostridium] symbiosum]|uniref:DUF2975 domain-containing protein n=1 Tax=Clostridium symbiosum TaxID=1512 RepID=UPI001D09738F|nr:DUF2975 domain-containing protein [[Clostridium] symbiosum]MCB6607419.1 DUF2975 domain-containing protein [[Clostridium] symbiosum]MCB6930025.1 DUF2975 domain-containing protein [[Clostridium] symbiosum]